MKKYLAIMFLSLSALVITSCGNPAETPPITEDSGASGETGKEEIDKAEDSQKPEDTKKPEDTGELEIGIQPGMKAPDFTLLDGDDEEISLSDYEGRVTFLNFWATTCPYCIDEMPDLEEFYQNNKDNDDFALLGINMTRTWEKKSKDQLVEWLDEEGFTFPVVFDVDAKQAGQWMATSLPITFIIDKDGISLGAIIGKTDLQTLEKVYEEVRAQ